MKITSKGRGHFKIEAEINGELFSTITTNTIAIDCVGEDESYFEEDRYYDSESEARASLISEIKRNNWID